VDQGVEPYNVVLVVMDALRADRLSLYGNPRPTSPYLDALARQGVVFRNAYSQAPWTPSSMASLFTSTYQSVHGVTHSLAQDERFSVLDDDLVTLTETFHDAGYRTAAFSSQAWLLPQTGFSQGFEVFEKVSGIENIFESEVVVGHGIEWLQRHREDPVFLYLHILNPHSPYEPPPPFSRLWWRGEVPEQLRPMKRMNIDERWQFLSALGERPVSREEIDYLLAMYDGEISYADYWLGRLARELRRLGLFERTILVLTSDHGESFSQHGEFGHGTSLYNDQLHVPLVLVNPRLFPRGRERQEPVELIDLMPTLLAVTGLPIPDQVQGESLLAAELSATVYAEGRKLRQQKWMQDDWSLIASDGFRNFELYDLSADPGENHNLWDEQPEIALRLKKALAEQIRANRRHPDRIAPDERPLEAEVLDELRSLGYLQ